MPTANALPTAESLAENGRAAISTAVSSSTRAQDRRELCFAKQLIGPKHEGAVGYESRNALGFIGGELHSANPQQDQDQAVSNGMASDRFNPFGPACRGGCEVMKSHLVRRAFFRVLQWTWQFFPRVREWKRNVADDQRRVASLQGRFSFRPLHLCPPGSSRRRLLDLGCRSTAIPYEEKQKLPNGCLVLLSKSFAAKRDGSWKLIMGDSNGAVSKALFRQKRRGGK